MVRCDITLSLMVCIVSFNVISELQRERLHHSHAMHSVELELWMNMWMISASEELSVFFLVIA